MTSQTMQQCIQNCQDCHRICAETVQHCLQQGGRHAEPDHVRDLLDCEQICALSADFMIRQSPFHERTCAVCAEVCARCAESCEQVNDGPAMQRCVDICRQCEDSCRQMAGAAAH